LDSNTLAYKIAKFGLEKKGKHIVVMDLHNITSVADFFVIISGDSDTQLKALSDHIIRKLKEEKIKIYHREGYETLRWVLLDYVDVIVHIFRNETREYYGLERLWGDAKVDFILDEKYDT
jgi:ribosome-associated protein